MTEIRELIKIFSSIALSCVFLLYAGSVSVRAGESKPAWETEWNETVEAAKKEGQIAVYHTRGPFDKLFADFSKRYPGIKFISATGRGGELISRVMSERRAGKYLVDIYLGATGTPLDVLYPGKLLEPIQPILVLPEVKDQSNWFGKRHHYGDPEGKYIFVFEGVVRSDMAYNTTLVETKEFTSYWDLLKSKWKGKIAAIDPKLAGFPEGFLQFAYYHADLGAKFLRQLFGEMDITISRDGRQIVDWLAVGKFAIAIGTSASDIQAGMKSNLPLSRFEPRAFKEGIYMRATQGSLSILNRLPHLNATKVFVNWLLSREGQTKFQNHFMRIDPVFSLRDDVVVDPSVEPYRPKPGDKFMPVYRPEYRDLQGAYKVIDEAATR
ncbi:MAG: extracellular solute-binding protein [Deltaproteobacteria bacterium]|nr:MAG: extracellular solute-binding protein [Deltaproteobacteria bacterium]